MTPEDIVRQVEIDMKEGGLDYQPAYWKMKLLLRIQALVENERAKASKGSPGVGAVGAQSSGVRSDQGKDAGALPKPPEGSGGGAQGQ